MNNHDITTRQEAIEYFKNMFTNNDFVASRIENAIFNEIHSISNEMIRTEMRYNFGRINWDSIAQEFSPNQIVDITSISSKLASDIVSDIQKDLDGKMLPFLVNRVGSLDEKVNGIPSKYVYLTD